MQAVVFLIETACQQVVVDAVDYFVFQLAHVLYLQGLHHLSVGHYCLFGGHVCNSDQFKLAELGRLKGKVGAWALLVSIDSLVGE